MAERRLPEPVIEGGPYDVPSYRQWNRSRRKRARGTVADRAARYKGTLATAIVHGLMRALQRPPLTTKLYRRVELEPLLPAKGRR